MFRYSLNVSSKNKCHTMMFVNIWIQSCMSPGLEYGKGSFCGAFAQTVLLLIRLGKR